MSRSTYASRTLAHEIEQVFDGELLVEHVGEPDGWGVTRGLQVTGPEPALVALGVVLGRALAQRPAASGPISRVTCLTGAMLIDFKPRADDPALFGLRALRNALG